MMAHSVVARVISKEKGNNKKQYVKQTKLRHKTGRAAKKGYKRQERITATDTSIHHETTKKKVQMTHS